MQLPNLCRFGKRGTRMHEQVLLEVALDCATIFSVLEDFLACYHAKADYRMLESQCEDHNILRNTVAKCSHFIFSCFSN